MDPSFWSGRRVLVTGHTGFKGSWLALWLQRMGAHVCGLALAPPTQPSLFDRAGVAAGLVDLRVDVRDADAVRQALTDHPPEIIFHLAAQPLVRLSYADPVTTYATNVMGTVHLLEAARRVASLRSVVVVTSDKCYENREWNWGYRESDPLGGHDPYSSSKGCTELVAAAYRRSFFSTAATPVGLATVRAGNVIGGGDWAADRIVPDILRALQRDESILVRNPRAIRPWQHVLEPLRGYLTLAQQLTEHPADWSEGWNFGPSEEDARPVEELVERAIALWGSGAWHTPLDRRPLHEARRLKLDCSQAQERLGWRPRLNLDAALRLTVEWHRAEQAGVDMRDFTWRQIEEYQSLAGRVDSRAPRPSSSSSSSAREHLPCHPPQRSADRAAKAV
ncbi:MAG: CDP-glucose 4,6-dehydratase [Pirellulales bacterium]